MAKISDARIFGEIARTARTILGENGIMSEDPSMRHTHNLETVYAYEGIPTFRV